MNPGFKKWWDEKGDTETSGNYDMHLVEVGWNAAQAAMTPSWDDAPNWANYRAKDQYGSWIYFETKPIAHSEGWASQLLSKSEHVTHSDWKESLQERPK